MQVQPTMDWQLAITRNRTALLVIITALMASVGLAASGALTTLPHFLYRRALLIIRPAESALRRLIMIAALTLTPRAVLSPTGRTAPVDFVRRKARVAPRLPTFDLIDRLKTYSEDAPDFSAFGAAHGDDTTPVSAEALGRRLLALQNALETIPYQAKRLARWYAQRDLALAQNQPHRLSPIRPGRLPYAHLAKRSAMDALLTECHLLAIDARDRRDSS
jgi:hypothetical protein